MADWLPRLATIEDPIADDSWAYQTAEGEKRLSRVTVGRPAPIPGDENGDWYCPLFFEHVTPDIKCVVGVGPVDALMNAMNFVWDRFRELHRVTPRAKPPTPGA
jgi:hypothetical protein